LLIYLGGKPADDCTVRFWLEPTWHLVGPRGVLVGSRQAQVEGKEALSRVGEPLNQLDGKVLHEISIEQLTFDLRLTFDDGYLISTFASDPTDDESWYVKDNASKIYIVASPAGLRIEERETAESRMDDNRRT
jgi:hypothetical protein